MTRACNDVELFGGAIVASIPVNFVDVSKIRQVPDSQEVYIQKDGFTSLTFDITERVSHLSTNKEALEYHFADIVAETDTSDILSVVENVKLANFPPNTPILALTAITKPSVSTVPANALTMDHTVIHFTLIRLLAETTDIVITLNIPCLAGAAAGQTSNEPEAEATKTEIEQKARETYEQIVTSFMIKDWGLFSDE